MAHKKPYIKNGKLYTNEIESPSIATIVEGENILFEKQPDGTYKISSSDKDVLSKYSETLAEFIEIVLDSNGLIIQGIKKDGTVYIPKIESFTLTKLFEDAKSYTDTVVDNKIKDVTTFVTPIIQNEDSRDELIRMFKSMICCGDSVTHGHIFYNGRGSTVSSLFSYPTQLGKMFPEINITNAGQSGQSIPGWNKSNFYNYDFTKFDLCLIELGWNSGEGPLYDTFDTDVAPYGDNYEQYADTGMGNYCQLIKKIENVNPYIFICLVCPKGWRDDNSFYKGMRNAVKHIGREFNLPVIDLADDSLYPLNYEDANAPANPELRGVHSSPWGYLMKATYIKQGIGRAISEFSEKAIKCCFGRNDMMCKVTIIVNDETLISTNVDYTEVLACYTSILECTLLNQNAIFDGWFYNNEKLSGDLIFTFDPYVKFKYSVPKAITIEARAHSK